MNDWKNKEYLYKEIMVEGKNAMAIALKFNIPVTNVESVLETYRECDNDFKYKPLPSSEDDWRNHDYLHYYYIEKNMKMEALQQHLGLKSRGAMWSVLNKFGLTGTTLKSGITRGIDEYKVRVDNPIFCYYAGLIATDGFIREGVGKHGYIIINLSGEDSLRILNTIASYFEYGGEIKIRENHGGFSDKPFYEFTVTSEVLTKTLRSMGIYGKKKDLLERMPSLEQYNEECQRMFIRGIMDGDGTIDPARGRMQIITESFAFIQKLQDFINFKLDTNYEIKTRIINGKEMPYILLPKVDSLRLFKWMYEGYEEFRINYKYERYLRSY